MPSIRILKSDITLLETDAIVNAANEGLWAGGGVCGAIFRAAGHTQLQEACSKIGHCDTGSAVITPGFHLKAKYIIHAVGPIWHGGSYHETELLYNAYANALNLAAEYNCKSIAFPLISAGIFGVPLDVAWRTALSACRDYQKNNPEMPMDIYFAILLDEIIDAGREILEKEN